MTKSYRDGYIDKYLGKKVSVYLKDGRKLKGIMKCSDSAKFYFVDSERCQIFVKSDFKEAFVEKEVV